MKGVLTTLAALLVVSACGAQNPNCPTPHANGQRIKIIFYADSKDCSKYLQCINGLLYNGSCPEGLVWNPNVESCDSPFNYKCNTSKQRLNAAPASNPNAKPVNSSDISCPPPSADGSRNITFYPNEDDCRKYWECDNGQLLEVTCPDGLVWLQELNTCDWEYLHPCNSPPKSANSWWSWTAVDRRQVIKPEPVEAAPASQSSKSD